MKENIEWTSKSKIIRGGGGDDDDAIVAGPKYTKTHQGTG